MTFLKYFLRSYIPLESVSIQAKRAVNHELLCIATVAMM